MRDFQNGVVYALMAGGRPVSDYIGSTTQSLQHRLCQHRKAYKQFAVQFPHRKLFQCFDEVGVDNVTIELIEPVPCATYDALLDAERRQILAHATHVHGCNQRIAGGQPGGQHLRQREKRLIYHKEYHRKLVESRAAVPATPTETI